MTTPDKRSGNRNSNFELLRIVAMLMIVIGHLYKFWDNSAVSQEEGIIYPWFLTNQGVDIFILISGIFGINVSIKKYVSLWLTIVYYGFICAVILWLGLDKPISILLTMPLREGLVIPSHLWFVSTYFALMVFSPLINTLFTKSKVTQFYYCILFLGVDVVFQTRTPLFYGLTTWGGSLLHFIALYVLGRIVFLWKIKMPLILVIGVYLISVVLGFFMWDNALYSGKDTSIWIILPSLCLIFICKDTKSFYNRLINHIAQASFGVYCFHALLISLISIIINPILSQIFMRMGNAGVTLISCGISILIYLITLPVDSLRRWINNMIESYLLKFIDVVNLRITKIIS